MKVNFEIDINEINWDELKTTNLPFPHGITDYIEYNINSSKILLKKLLEQKVPQDSVVLIRLIEEKI